VIELLGGVGFDVEEGRTGKSVLGFAYRLERILRSENLAFTIQV
jgi:hypothetical protein